MYQSVNLKPALFPCRRCVQIRFHFAKKIRACSYDPSRPFSKRQKPIQSPYNHQPWPFIFPAAAHTIFPSPSEEIELPLHISSATMNFYGDSRKMKRVAEAANVTQNEEIMKLLGPYKSFTEMLNETMMTEFDNRILTPNMQHQGHQVDHIINTHKDLRRGLAEMWANKIIQQEMELKEKVNELKQKEMDLASKMHENQLLVAMLSNYRAEAHRLHCRNNQLEEISSSLRAETLNLSGMLRSKEQMVTSLQEALRTAVSARPAMEEADAESSYVDPTRDFSVKLGCKVCDKRLATVMLWPCSHVCVCPRCESTKTCPVCCTPSTTSVRLHLPLN